MSGHSKWHNIQKTKGAQDAKRAAAFTKIAKELIVAVKEGGGNRWWKVQFDQLLPTCQRLEACLSSWASVDEKADVFVESMGHDVMVRGARRATGDTGR